jgi:hypothetical protein
MSPNPNPYWPTNGIKNPAGGFPYPSQPDQPLVHYSTYNDALTWLNAGAIWQARWSPPILDLRNEWKASDAFLGASVASPAVGTFGNGRSLSIQLSGQLATVPWLQAWYVYDGAVSNSEVAAIGRLSQRVAVIDQIILGGTNAGSVNDPPGMSIVTLTPPAAVRFWRPILILELPIAATPPAVRVSAGMN